MNGRLRNRSVGMNLGFVSSRSDGSKICFIRVKHRKSVLLFFATLPVNNQANEGALAVYYTVIKHSGHLRTLEKCRKHSSAARVLYISLVFSNVYSF